MPFEHLDLNQATEHGPVVEVPNLHSGILLKDYKKGLFPWSSNPFGFFSPNPRAVFLTQHCTLPKNLKKLERKAQVTYRINHAFEQVITQCAKTRPTNETWICDAFIEAYTQLHHKGFAQCIEVYQQNQLVGGIYGVQIGHYFSGESMFHRIPNAAKFAFAQLIEVLKKQDIAVFDAQVPNAFTLGLGAKCVHRSVFLQWHQRCMQEAEAMGWRPKQWQDL